MTSRRSLADSRAILNLLEIGDSLLPHTLKAACRLRIADHLAAEPLTFAELAKRIGAYEVTLRKAVRYLAARGIFEVTGDTVRLSPMADLLREDHPYSARDVFLSPVICNRAMEGIDHAIRTGEPAFDAVHGLPMWQHFENHPDDGAAFDRVMGGVTGWELRAVLRALDWSRFATIVDVGGGNGTFLAGLLRRSRVARGIVFDLPAVVQGASEVMRAEGVADRMQVVGGSFLTDEIPAGHDAYLLKRILYSWSDDEAAAILGRVRAAMTSPQSRLLVMEAGYQDGQDTAMVRRMDLLMHTLTGGGVRSVSEQEAVLKRAGLRIAQVWDTPVYPIIEAMPA